MSDPASLAAPPSPTSLANPPFAGGRVVGAAFRVFGRHALPFCLVAVAFFSPAIVLDLATGEREEVTRFSSMLWSVLGCFVTAALTRGTLDTLEGREVRARALFGAGFGSGFRVLGVSMVVGLITLLGLVLLVIPGLVAAAGLYVASAVVVAQEGVPTRAALERSWGLTRGHRLAALGIGLLFLVMPVAVSIAAGAVGLLFAEHVGGAAVMVLGNVALAATMGLPPVAAAIAYRDLRAEKEGLGTAKLGAVFE